MLSPNVIPVLIALLVTFCAGGLVIAVFYKYIGGRTESHKRYTAIAVKPAVVDRPTIPGEIKRKKAIETTLRELEDKQKVRKASKPTLRGRLRQAGLSWNARTYYVACACAGAVFLAVAFGGFRVGLVPALGFGIAGGLLTPHIYVSAKRNYRFKSFSAEFPNAVDVIVRGVKAGLPLVDCLRIISTEAQEPVRSEFRLLLEDQTMGVPMDQAVQKLPERIPLPEASFFAIVISLQSRTGGSLAETLGNLSKVLRERKKMRAKIKAVSSEAKASAGIIGSLPIAVGAMLYLIAPAYINLLFSTTIGFVVLGGAAFWMALGVAVMRKMINFEI